MPTSVESTLGYRVIAAWFEKFRGDPNHPHPQFRPVQNLLKLFRDYQNAKEHLFQIDSNGNLPLVTKELAQDICEKYDALMGFYKYFARDLSEEPIELTYDTHQGREIYHKNLGQWADDMFDQLRKQDEKSIGFMKEYFRERFGYAPRAAANIQKIGNMDCPYPFHTDEEIQQLEAQNGEKFPGIQLLFGGLQVDPVGNGGAPLESIINISVEPVGKSQAEKGVNLPKTKVANAPIKLHRNSSSSAMLPKTDQMSRQISKEPTPEGRVHRKRMSLLPSFPKTKVPNAPAKPRRNSSLFTIRPKKLGK